LEKQKIVLDTETTGLLPEEHEIIELAIVNLDGKTLFNEKIKPKHIKTASPKALEINGYNKEDWSFARPFKEYAVIISNILDNSIVIGQNPLFDINFLDKQLKESLKKKYVKFHYGSHIDTKTLAYEHLSHVLKRFSLSIICDFFGFDTSNEHTALADARNTLKVYKKLNKATVLDRFLWKLKRMWLDRKR
jgi:DNA polymerase III epsilon subunit-like protein